MTQPTVTDVQAVDPVLQNVLLSYIQSESRFVADGAFPGVPVGTDSGTYYIFDKGYWLGDDMQVRAPGEQYARSDFKVSTSTYTTVQWALAKALADEVKANNQAPADLSTAAVRWLGLKALIRKERAFAGDFMTTSVWETDATGGSTFTKWSDSSSDPVGDVITGKRTISQSTGMKANKLIMGEIVRDRLVNHPDLLDRIKYTQRALASSVDEALSQIFDAEVMVASAIYNSANEAQTASISAIIDDDALLIYTTAAPSKEEPSAGYTFHWAPGGGLGAIQPMWRDGANDADLVKFKMQWDQKAVSTDLGYFFSDCTD